MAVSLRVATFNAHGFRAGVDRAVRAFADEEPQIVLVQECGPRRRVRAFGRELRLEVVSTHRIFNRMRNAILYPRSWRLAAAEAHHLTRRGRSLRRGLLAADLRQAGCRLTAISAHLGLSASERADHAREVTDYLAAIRGPVIMGIDLNAGPEEAATRWIADRLFDAWTAAGEGGGETFPAHEPTARIDYVFVTEGVRVQRAWVAGGGDASTASDHRAVVADVSVPDP